MRHQHHKYLDYIKNTAGHATMADFDDDWDPIGPMVRREIIPALATINGDGFLVLTDQGRAVLAQAD